MIKWLAFVYDIAQISCSYRNVLLDSATWEDAVQFWTQFSFAQKCEYNRLGKHGFQCVLAMSLTIDAEHYLERKNIG